MKNVMKIGLAAMLLLCSIGANAAWMMPNGLWYSNICRANFNPIFYWVYPVSVAQPVGTMCALPDGTPGTVTAH